MRGAGQGFAAALVHHYVDLIRLLVSSRRRGVGRLQNAPQFVFGDGRGKEIADGPPLLDYVEKSHCNSSSTRSSMAVMRAARTGESSDAVRTDGAVTPSSVK